MAFEEQIEQISDYFENLKERIQENTFFNKASDRFEALSPNMQKLLAVLACAFVVFLILSRPLSWYTESQENLTQFKARKNITQDIINFTKTAKNPTLNPKKYNLSEIKSKIAQFNSSPSLTILPEQSNVSVGAPLKTSLKNVRTQSFHIDSKNLNLKQITALTYSLKRLNKSVYINSLEINKSPEKLDYFNTRLTLANLYVQPVSEVLPKPEPFKKSRSKRKKRR